MRALITAASLALLAAPTASAANGWWTFDRNTNLNSVLSWTWTYPPNSTRYTHSWRAGSGTTTNECEKARGWLPAGWYALRGHWNDYPGSTIRGRVWWIQDKYCANGTTLRTELFIHTEETRERGQYCTSAYDDPFCWEREADYYSLGCIKLSRPSPVQTSRPTWQARTPITTPTVGRPTTAISPTTRTSSTCSVSGRVAAVAREPTIEDIDYLVGPATPHFAMQLRARVRALIRDLPEDHAVRRYGEEKIDLLERLAYASSKAEEGPVEPPTRPGWEYLPSHARPDDVE